MKRLGVFIGFLTLVSCPFFPIHSKALAQGYERQDVRLEELWRLGEEGDEAFFGDIRKVVVGENGYIFILDSQKEVVEMYDSEGQYIRDIGRKDTGPGEYNQPWGMFLMEGNRIAITQRFGRRVAVHPIDPTRPIEVLSPEDFKIPSTGVLDGVEQSKGRILVLTDDHNFSVRPPTFRRVLKLFRREKINSEDFQVETSSSQGHSGGHPGHASQTGHSKGGHPGGKSVDRSKDESIALREFSSYGFEVLRTKFEHDWDQIENCWVVNGSKLFVAENDAYVVHAWDIETGSKKIAFQRQTERCPRDKEENVKIAKDLDHFFGERAHLKDIETRKFHRAILGMQLRNDSEIWIQTGVDPCERDDDVVAVMDVWSLSGTFLKTIEFHSEGKYLGSSFRNRVYLHGDRMYVSTRGDGDQPMQLIAYSLPLDI